MSHFCEKENGEERVSCYEPDGLRLRCCIGGRAIGMDVSFCPFCGYTVDGISDKAEPEPTGSRLMHEAQPTIGNVINARLDDIDRRLDEIEGRVRVIVSHQLNAIAKEMNITLED